MKGINNLKAGVVFQHTFLTEDDSFGVVDPTANAPCLNADGSPYTNPGLTDPANCTGPLQANPGFIPILGCYDLTRTAPLPASDGCPNATSGLYAYNVHSDIKELALFAQDSITYKNWIFNLGLRGDLYNGISIARQAEPRVGAAYNIKKTNTVLRVSYARTMETPFNENLILASNGCTDPVINALMSSTISSLRQHHSAEPRHAAMSSTPASSKPSANTWLWTANTSGSTRKGASTSASWATHRLLFPSSGPNRKSLDMPSAPASRTPMASRRLW